MMDSKKKTVRTLCLFGMLPFTVLLLIAIFSGWDPVAVALIASFIVFLGIFAIFFIPLPKGKKRDQMIKDSEALFVFGMMMHQQKRNAEIMDKLDDNKH